MSVEIERPAKDIAVQSSRIVLVILLPSIFIAFCILAYFAKPPAMAGTRADLGIDPIRTSSIQAKADPRPAAGYDAGAIDSGYGVDDGIARP